MCSEIILKIKYLWARDEKGLHCLTLSLRTVGLNIELLQYVLNPDNALELRYERLNHTESGSFTGFSIATLWLNQKTHTFH